MDNEEVVYSTATMYKVLDVDVYLFGSDTVYGWKSFAEIDGVYHYLDDSLITLHTAMNLWEYLNNRLLTREEAKLVLKENPPFKGI